VDGTVRAVCVRGDDVFVGGELTVAGGAVAASRLARWDGRRWFDVGGGVSYSQTPPLAVVRALATDGTRLFVAGLFDRVGRGDQAVAANGLAAFDLTTGTWTAFGDGLLSLGSAGEGRALLLDGQRLLVGGYFDSAGGIPTFSLASIDLPTGTWTTYGTGIRDGEYAAQVESLALDPRTHAVYVGGSFTAADTVTASGVVRLDDGTFTALGEFTYYGSASTASVKALALTPGAADDGTQTLVYAGGEFTTAGDSASPSWAVYDGTGWSAPWGPVDNVVRALAPVSVDGREGVVVVGSFVSSGELRITHAGMWLGEGWQTFGQGVSYDPYADGNVFAVSVESPGVVVAGGYFDQAGPVRVGSIARWTPCGWAALGTGVAASNGLGKICAMARLGGDLYVTGSFSRAGDGAASNIARWDGTSWSAVGGGLSGTGYALTVLGGRLYVGGSFGAAGTATASAVAVWDPQTSSWSALGNAPVYDDDVLALTALGERYLVIGGEYNAFRRNNRDVVRGLNGMVLFDTQAPLDPADPASGYFVLAGVKRSLGPGTVRALQVLGDDLFVGGAFDTAGVMELGAAQETGFAAQNLAVWHFGTDGTWASPGGTDQPVQALTALEGARLAVAGWFTVAGPVPAAGVAELDPATGAWSAYGSGLGGGLRGVLHGEALGVDPAAGLWVGGTFNTAGGHPSCGLALWSPTAGHTP
jgi:hypothetical protein